VKWCTCYISNFAVQQPLTGSPDPFDGAGMLPLLLWDQGRAEPLFLPRRGLGSERNLAVSAHLRDTNILSELAPEPFPAHKRGLTGPLLLLEPLFQVQQVNKFSVRLLQGRLGAWLAIDPASEFDQLRIIGPHLLVGGVE
jgi:hypothetical protein